MTRILIVDDDLELCGLLSDYLGTEGCQCLAVHDGSAGLNMIVDRRAELDLVILDVMLPGQNGFEILKEVRKAGLTVPIIMLTAKGEAVDLILGLEMGADDYLPKPFNPRELLARLRSVLRRAAGPQEVSPPEGRLEIDGFVLDEKSYQAGFQNRPLHLTPLEFKILWLLLSRPGQIISRRTLYKEALGRRENAFDRSLDMHISRLRKKIWPDSESSENLKSIRGEGYLYVPAGRRLS